ncbi:MAG TPA: hypothetical protein VF590_19140 [Isosphaeraceae bacterium]|jgi:hypothetical protein
MSIATLTLEADDVQDACHWYWRLRAPNGATLADHEVALDSSDWRYQAFLDLFSYLGHQVAPDKWAEDGTSLVQQVGEWIGMQVLGAVGTTILARGRGKPITVRVAIPAAEVAAGLQYLPLELAYVGGRPLAMQDVSLVFEIVGEGSLVEAEPIGKRLRMLAVFSLPTDANALTCGTSGTSSRR